MLRQKWHKRRKHLAKLYQYDIQHIIATHLLTIIFGLPKATTIASDIPISQILYKKNDRSDRRLYVIRQHGGVYSIYEESKLTDDPFVQVIGKHKSLEIMDAVFGRYKLIDVGIGSKKCIGIS